MRRWQLKLAWLLMAVFVALGVTMLVLMLGGFLEDPWAMAGFFTAFMAYGLFFLWLFKRLYRSAQRDLSRELHEKLTGLYQDEPADQGSAGDTGDSPEVLPNRQDG